MDARQLHIRSNPYRLNLPIQSGLLAASETSEFRLATVSVEVHVSPRRPVQVRRV